MRDAEAGSSKIETTMREVQRHFRHRAGRGRRIGGSRCKSSGGGPPFAKRCSARTSVRLRTAPGCPYRGASFGAEVPNAVAARYRGYHSLQ